jgi:hypothetical protein
LAASNCFGSIKLFLTKLTIEIVITAFCIILIQSIENGCI